MLPTGWIAVAAGFGFNFFNSKIQAERKARIERVNSQLKEFYGPLLACVTATKSGYEAMILQHSPDGTHGTFQKALQQDPDGPEAKCYRLWVMEVLQPLNERAAAAITEHIDLLDTATLETMLLQLVAHVFALRVTLSRWRQGDTAALSSISYPDGITETITREFTRIKHRQAVLLGNVNNVRSKL